MDTRCSASLPKSGCVRPRADAFAEVQPTIPSDSQCLLSDFEPRNPIPFHGDCGIRDRTPDATCEAAPLTPSSIGNPTVPKVSRADSTL